jgi:phosphoribosylanthranilate isomerase
MKRSVQIKVCGLTREEDVDLALSLGADYCGFILYSKSPRGISLNRATELASRVPSGKRVMVDVEPGSEALMQARDAGFDYFQIHSNLQVLGSNAATLKAWSGLVGIERLWLAPRLAPGDSFPEAMLEFADTILLDTFAKNQIGGTGKVGDWAQFNRLKAAHSQTRWILAGGLSPANVLEAVTSTGADHLDLNSGVESAPGVKDAAKLREVFRIL